MKAVESPQKDDDTKWLTYWVVFSTFSIAEYFSNVICNWIPVYWLLKVNILSFILFIFLKCIYIFSCARVIIRVESRVPTKCVIEITLIKFIKN